MSTTDDDLAALGLDDEDEDDEGTPTAAPQDSSVINQLRKQLRDEKKSRKAAEERLSSVEPFREKYLTSQAPKVLEEAGVDPSLHKLFVKDNPTSDLTPDLAKSWATENGIAVKEPEEETPQTSGAESTFAPTVGGEAPGLKALDEAAFNELMDKNPAEAVRAMQQNRVRFSNPDAQSQLEAARGGVR